MKPLAPVTSTGCRAVVSILIRAPKPNILQNHIRMHKPPGMPGKARKWAPLGPQSEVPSPGQNQKKVVYGRVEHATKRSYNPSICLLYPF